MRVLAANRNRVARGQSRYGHLDDENTSYFLRILAPHGVWGCTSVSHCEASKDIDYCFWIQGAQIAEVRFGIEIRCERRERFDESKSFLQEHRETASEIVLSVGYCAALLC